jgi:hypothetical protein
MFPVQSLHYSSKVYFEKILVVFYIDDILKFYYFGYNGYNNKKLINIIFIFTFLRVATMGIWKYKWTCIFLFDSTPLDLPR